MTNLRLRSAYGADELVVLKAIWRSAVDATHDFLAPADRDAIEHALLTAYFPLVRLTVAERAGAPVGFAGTADGRLEMLFVRADELGRGVGSALLAHVVAACGAREVDVNEQNQRALAFYERHGFVEYARSPLDGQGRPYPLRHLRLPPR